jgi:2'-5' RNA ligase
MKYFIGYLLEDGALDYYNNITTELSEKFGIENLSEYIPPHFTFKPPFNFDDEEKLNEELRQVAKSIKSFSVTIDDFGTFDFESKTIYIKPKYDESSQSKFENIVSMTNSVGDSGVKGWDPFRPHASIARHLDANKSEEIWSYLQSYEKPKIDCNVDNLTLFVKEDGKWGVKNIFRF